MSLGGIILGAPKCATTSLYHYLQQHPDVACPMPKEGHFLLRDLFPQPSSYVEPTWVDGKFNVDVGTDTAYYPAALRQLADQFPAAKALLIVRNPVELAISLHSQRCKTGGENHKLPRALDDGHLQRLRKETSRPGLLGYLQAARLKPVISDAQSILGERLLVLHFEDLEKNPQAWMNEVLRHFGLAQFDFDFSSQHNVDERPKSSKVANFLANPPSAIATPWRLLPSAFRDFVGSRLESLNSQKIDRELPRTVREKLELLLREDVAAVAGIPSLVS